MDPSVSGSFIPKKPLTSDARRLGGGGLLTLLGLLCFVGSIAAAALVFGYHTLLMRNLVQSEQSLERAEGAFDSAVIQDLVRLDQRIDQAKSLLARHVAPSLIFSILAGITLERVQFTSFDYELQSEGGAAIALSGIADSFSVVALQSDAFGASRELRDVVFSDIAVNESGRVTFTVRATVTTPNILYSKSLGGVSVEEPPATAL